MLEASSVQALKSLLFTGEPATVFAILDGASVPELLGNLSSFRPEQVCLYRGELEPDLAEVAPYLAVLELNSPFTDWVLSNGWGKHWGIFGSARADLPALRKHFRQKVMVYDAAGRSLYFRYYDPRVLREYLPACGEKELLALFGPVRSFLVEDAENAQAREFFLFDGVLREERVPLS